MCTTDSDGTNIKSQQKQTTCHTYFLKDFRPELLELPFVEDYGPEECKLMTLSKDVTTAEDVAKYVSTVKQKYVSC